jgi:hypothetical protein
VRVTYSKHIKTRLKLRKLDYELPRRIFENAEERFLDTETGNTIAVANDLIYGKKRNIMVAYNQETQKIKLLTIHPLKEGQKENRIKSGRWRRL